jgi:hypothetical protein
MPALAFDTMKLARKLRENAKFPAEQAEQTAEAISDSLIEWKTNSDLATRDDVQKSETGLRGEIQELRADMKVMEVSLRGEIKSTVAESKAEILKWMFTAIITQTLIIVGTLVALLHNIGKL